MAHEEPKWTPASLRQDHPVEHTPSREVIITETTHPVPSARLPRQDLPRWPQPKPSNAAAAALPFASRATSHPLAGPVPETASPGAEQTADAAPASPPPAPAAHAPAQPLQRRHPAQPAHACARSATPAAFCTTSPRPGTALLPPRPPRAAAPGRARPACGRRRAQRGSGVDRQTPGDPCIGSS